MQVRHRDKYTKDKLKLFSTLVLLLRSWLKLSRPLTFKHEDGLC